MYTESKFHLHLELLNLMDLTQMWDFHQGYNILHKSYCNSKISPAGWVFPENCPGDCPGDYPGSTLYPGARCVDRSGRLQLVHVVWTGVVVFNNSRGLNGNIYRSILNTARPSMSHLSITVIEQVKNKRHLIQKGCERINFL